MRKEAIVVDLDNTLVDTAVRKLSLLREYLPHEQIDIEKIRSDFDLVTILGSRETKTNEGFFAKLESSEAIRKHPAPLFPEVSNILTKLTDKNIDVIVITGRSESLADETKGELAALNIIKFISHVYMCPSTFKSVEQFKTKMISDLQRDYDFIAVVGDHYDDYSAATENKIPFIKLEITNLTYVNSAQVIDASVTRCNSWDKVLTVIETIIEGRRKIKELRNSFTESYARWLADLDNKGRITATIASLLATLAGKIVFDLKTCFQYSDYLLGAAFFLCVLSLLYCLRSITSRRTSGHIAGNRIIANFKQALGILFGGPANWQCQKGDPISMYRELCSMAPEDQTRAHYDFFKQAFNTYDPDILANLRLYQLRSVNHEKAYAESIASLLLVSAIVLFLLWFGIYIVR